MCKPFLFRVHLWTEATAFDRNFNFNLSHTPTECMLRKRNELCRGRRRLAVVAVIGVVVVVSAIVFVVLVCVLVLVPVAESMQQP